MSSANVSGLLHFIHNSPTPFHAVANLSALFVEHGFVRVDEKQDWQLAPAGKYFVVRSDSSIVAFIVGAQSCVEQGIRLVGAHSDSPCLKVKPNPEILKNNYLQLGVEIYGGALLNPWFDRDLSLAGKITALDMDGKLCSILLDFKKPIATIPSLAIHLDRDANNNKTVNPQREMNAILWQSTKKTSFKQRLLAQAKIEHPQLALADVLDFNLSFYDTQVPAVIGMDDEFIASARLDNLLSTYVGAIALLAADATCTSVFICNDHEEIGSRSETGAQGTLLNDVIARLVPNTIDQQKCMRRSLMLSVDNAHGIHPNYADKHDQEHGPELNAGPVIKFNSDQSYATNSETAAVLRVLAANSTLIADGIDPASDATQVVNSGTIPLQNFVMRSDLRCGSTIGPITATNSGIKTVDLGVATFAMHSIRELGGVKDVDMLHDLLVRFYTCEQLPI